MWRAIFSKEVVTMLQSQQLYTDKLDPIERLLQNGVITLNDENALVETIRFTMDPMAEYMYAISLLEADTPDGYQKTLKDIQEKGNIAEGLSIAIKITADSWQDLMAQKM